MWRQRLTIEVIHVLDWEWHGLRDVGVDTFLLTLEGGQSYHCVHLEVQSEHAVGHLQREAWLIALHKHCV